MSETEIIQGQRELQAALDKIEAAVKPSGALGQAVQVVTRHAWTLAQDASHVWTGALQASHRWSFAEVGADARGLVTVGEGVVNPRTHEDVREYAPIEHARGGSHAFYARVVEDYGDDLLGLGATALLDALP